MFLLAVAALVAVRLWLDSTDDSTDEEDNDDE